tara:strand:- start:472 stop:600 length:129 start_codon:yes stop_codon:yes gene_type:complete
MQQHLDGIKGILAVISKTNIFLPAKEIRIVDFLKSNDQKYLY